MDAPPTHSHEPLLKTKLSIPQPRTSLVSRPRLFDFLTEGMDRALTLICAPAGYGKTTLLVDWISSYQNLNDPFSLSFGWLSLDDGDNHPTRFLSYLAAAFIDGKAKLSDETRSVILAFPPPPLRTALTFMINDLVALAKPITLILDDYQLITNSEIHAGIEYFLDRIPGYVHLILATRSDPPFPLARQRARHQLVEIRADQLRFTPDEAADFFQQVMKLPLTIEEITTLETRTEGWIAGLQMAGLSMRGHPDTLKFIRAFSGSHRYILDYLAEEVFNRQPDNIQHFLLTTSILDRLCGDLCDALTDSRPRASQSILEYLDHANLFLVSLDDKREWFRYHQLFADILHARLYQSVPEVVPKLHARASEWYENNNLPNEAVQHAFSADDNERAADLIEHYAPIRWLEGDTSIAQMGARLPVEMLITRPRLGIYQTWLLIGQGHVQRAAALLNDLEQHLTAESPGIGPGWMLNVIGLVRAYIAPPVEESTAVSLPDFQALDEIPEEDLILRIAADILYGTLLGRRGEIDLAADVFVRCIERERKSDRSMAIPTAIPILVRFRLMQGQLREAEALCRELLKPQNDSGARLLYSSGGMKIALGDILYEWNRLKEAEEFVREGIRDNEPWGSISDVLGYLTLVRILQAKGDHEEALRIADKLEKRLEGRVQALELEDELSTLRIRLLLANGELQIPAAWADRIQFAEPPDFRQEHHRLTLARIRLAQGEYAEAKRILDGMASLAGAGGRVTRQLKFDLLLAIVQFKQSNIPGALQRLDACLSQAEPEGYVRLFLDSGEPARELLSHYLRSPTTRHKEYARQLVNTFSNPSQDFSPAISMTGLFEPLTGRELEVLRLLVDGFSNRQIAEKLFLAEGTVKYYVHSILKKLQVRSRTQAIARARELGLA